MRPKVAATWIIAFGIALLCPASNALAATVTYRGADEVMLVMRPNSAGSNVRGARAQPRELPTDYVRAVLNPIVETAMSGCSLAGISRIVVSPHGITDRIGGTPGQIQGFGLYLNLPDADRVQTGHWFIAPYFSLTIEVGDEAGTTTQRIDLFEFDRLKLANVSVTQSAFNDTAPEAIAQTVFNFVKVRLPAALRKALPDRCGRDAGD